MLYVHVGSPFSWTRHCIRVCRQRYQAGRWSCNGELRSQFLFTGHTKAHGDVKTPANVDAQNTTLRLVPLPTFLGQRRQECLSIADGAWERLLRATDDTIPRGSNRACMPLIERSVPGKRHSTSLDLAHHTTWFHTMSTIQKRQLSGGRYHVIAFLYFFPPCYTHPTNTVLFSNHFHTVAPIRQRAERNGELSELQEPVNSVPHGRMHEEHSRDTPSSGNKWCSITLAGGWLAQHKSLFLSCVAVASAFNGILRYGSTHTNGLSIFHTITKAVAHSLSRPLDERPRERTRETRHWLAMLMTALNAGREASGPP
jgi:hypothetical protein